MIVDALFAQKPVFHLAGDETTPANYHADERLLRVFDEIARPGLRTLETGCGYSTVVFAQNGCSHTAVAPLQGEFDEIARYCYANDIDLSTTNLVCADSADVLPRLSDPIDLLFIDGAHSFPYPMVDYYYGERLLEVGGLLIVDDVPIMGCFLLMHFLKGDPHFEEIEQNAQFAIYRKVMEPQNRTWWTPQPFSADKIYSLNDFLPKFGTWNTQY